MLFSVGGRQLLRIYMDLQIAVLILALSTFIFVTLFYLSLIKIAHYKKELEALKSQPKTESYEVKDLLQDLLRGKALIELRRIEPASVMLRSIKE